jgi:branched-chain amino acid transport system substrate-binding protein
MNRSRFGSLFLAASAAWIAAAAASSGAALGDFPPYTKVLSISLVAPLSGSQRQFGIDLSNGVRLAVDEANESRALTDFGWTLQTFDDQADPGIAMQEAKFALVDPTTAFVIGHVGAEETNFALQTYHEQEVPLIVPTQSYYGLTQHGFDNVFRLCPTDIDEGMATAKYAERTMKATKVAIVYVKDQFGVDSGQGFQTYAASGTTTKTESFGVDVDLKSDKDIVAAIKAFAPDALFFSGSGSYLSKILDDVRAAGVTVPAIANDGFYDAGALKSAGAAADGMIVSTCVPPLDLIPTAQLFVRHYQSRFGQVSAFGLYGYVATQIAMAAAKQGHTATHLSIDRILSVGTFQTVIGPVSFQKNGDPFQPNVYFYKANGGGFKFDSSSIPNALVISR